MCGTENLNIMWFCNPSGEKTILLWSFYNPTCLTRTTIFAVRHTEFGVNTGSYTILCRALSNRSPGQMPVFNLLGELLRKIRIRRKYLEVIVLTLAQVSTAQYRSILSPRVLCLELGYPNRFWQIIWKIHDFERAFLTYDVKVTFNSAYITVPHALSLTL